MNKGKKMVLFRIRQIAVSIIIFLIAGCATTQSIPVETRFDVVNANFDKTLTATAEYFTERGFLIKTMDKKTGLIDSDYKYRSPIKATLLGDRRTKVNAIISKIDTNSAKITLNLISERKPIFRPWRRAEFLDKQTLEKVYKQYVSGIREKAEN